MTIKHDPKIWPGRQSEENFETFINDWSFDPALKEGQIEKMEETISAMRSFIVRLVKVLVERNSLTAEELKEIADIPGDVEIFE